MYIKNILAELRQHFEVIYGERMIQMILFGSHARDDANSGSDIDVMVLLREQVEPVDEIARTSEIKSELSLKYDVVISCIFISVDRYISERSPLILNVHKEGIAI